MISAAATSKPKSARSPKPKRAKDGLQSIIPLSCQQLSDAGVRILVGNLIWVPAVRRRAFGILEARHFSREPEFRVLWFLMMMCEASDYSPYDLDATLLGEFVLYCDNLVRRGQFTSAQRDRFLARSAGRLDSISPYFRAEVDQDAGVLDIIDRGKARRIHNTKMGLGLLKQFLVERMFGEEAEECLAMHGERSEEFRAMKRLHESHWERILAWPIR